MNEHEILNAAEVPCSSAELKWSLVHHEDIIAASAFAAARFAFSRIRLVSHWESVTDYGSTEPPSQLSQRFRFLR